MIKIRQECKDDYNEVYDVVKSAFESAEHSDGDEQELVVRLRKSKNFIERLSLVAEVDGKIAGHIMFTKIDIAGTVQLALAPLAVLPEYQKKGIGTALIKEGHCIASQLGYDFSVVLGSENYYPKFGYKKASLYGIRAPFDVPDENFMAFKLNDKDMLLNGVVKYAEEFGI